MSVFVLLFIGILIVALVSRRLVTSHRTMIPYYASRLMTPGTPQAERLEPAFNPPPQPAAPGGIFESFAERDAPETIDRDAVPVRISETDPNIVAPRSPMSPIPPKEPMAPIPAMRL